ncbi:MAG: hypothetical protein Q8Q81_00595 [Oxalobacteraceae bacterium]|nr:hypothetical protein [Oxalobacteraceae bacterium]
MSSFSGVRSIFSGLGAVLTLSASAFTAINPWAPPLVATGAASYSRRSRSIGGSVAQAKRAAAKRVNQQRHKRARRG